jgi:hypothetical protein
MTLPAAESAAGSSTCTSLQQQQQQQQLKGCYCCKAITAHALEMFRSGRLQMTLPAAKSAAGSSTCTSLQQQQQQQQQYVLQQDKQLSATLHSSRQRPGTWNRTFCRSSWHHYA